ncbi:MAG: hypothetical protein AAB263_15190 [Planctomycetota bacterium]
MPRIPLRDLRVGMLLASPAIGPGGKQLLPAGVMVEEKHLQVLRAWGIDAVELADAVTSATGTDAAAVAAIAAQRSLQAAQRAVALRFRGQPVDHQAVRALFAIAVIREVRRAGAAK